MLLDEGENIEVFINTGPTALFISALYGRPEVVKLLLREGAHANTEAARNVNGGATALFVSACKVHLEVVKLLLDWGANTETAR